MLTINTVRLLTSACLAKIDVGFLVDGSGSIERGRPGNFAKVKSFVKRMASAFVVNPKAARIGAVVYSSSAKAVFKFNRYKDINGVKKAIDRMPYLGKRTNTGFGLRFAHRYLFARAPKRSRKRVLIVFTNGRSKDDVRIGASGLKATGVEVIVVGVGSSINYPQLLQIASSPSHVVRTAFSTLPKIIKVVKKKACRRAPRPVGKLSHLLLLCNVGYAGDILRMNVP